LLSRRRPVFDVIEASTTFEPVPRAEARRATGMDGDPAVVWVGRLVEDKDPLTALAGFARFVAAGAPAARLWMICTDRTLLPRVGAAIEASPVLRDRVRVGGPVVHDEVATWLSAADLYLSTSRHEGSGYALIEALACGCPPVVSDLPSHAAIAGGAGRRFPPGDPAALAVTLRAAPRGPDARSAARRAFEERLRWDVVVEQLLTAYRVCADLSGPLASIHRSTVGMSCEGGALVARGSLVVLVVGACALSGRHASGCVVGAWCVSAAAPVRGGRSAEQGQGADPVEGGVEGPCPGPVCG
jgi:glycosyltransferase involved in cell wall biosynthesis